MIVIFINVDTIRIIRLPVQRKIFTTKKNYG